MKPKITDNSESLIAKAPSSRTETQTDAKRESWTQIDRGLLKPPLPRRPSMIQTHNQNPRRSLISHLSQSRTATRAGHITNPRNEG